MERSALRYAVAAMPQLFSAGVDWTATPSLNEPFPYGPALVAVEDESELEAAWEEIQLRFGFRSEIKGHDSSGEVLNAVFEALEKCKASVGSLLLDKRALLTIPNALLPAPATLRHQMAVALTTRFIEQHALARLLCDEEIRGKSEWGAFRTDILRANRRLHPTQKMRVAAWPSHKSVLIQAADCVAYAFAREIRGATLDAPVRARLRAMQEREGNFFVVTDKWEGETVRKIDLRPYLRPVKITAFGKALQRRRTLSDRLGRRNVSHPKIPQTSGKFH